MGTSTPFRGGKNSNPLRPSWLPNPDGGGMPPGAPPDNSPDVPPDEALGQPAPEPVLGQPGPIPPQPALRRFTGARRSFNEYARSDGRDNRSRARAVRSYIRRTGGGARATASRMASERGSGARFAGILSDASTVGIREVARRLNLASVADRPIEEVYVALVDVVCAPGGDLDDSYAREAYVEAICDISALGLPDLERPSPETISILMGAFMTNAINIRMLNAIGNRVVVLPTDVEAVRNIQDQMKDFIRGAVEEALFDVGPEFSVVDVRTRMDELFERTIIILEAYANSDAGEDDQ